MTSEELLIRLDALTQLLAAQQIALSQLLQNHSAHLQAMGIPLPGFEQTYVAHRREALHRILEGIEAHDPARAARLHAILDRDDLHYPLGYDEQQ